NGKPARVFMGGVGAEALGAGLAGLAITTGSFWYLPLLALVPVLVVLSVIAQVTYFKLTDGKRLLRMTPLHHHFELSGWSEEQLVRRVGLVTARGAALVVWLFRGTGWGSSAAAADAAGWRPPGAASARGMTWSSWTAEPMAPTSVKRSPSEQRAWAA